MPSAEEIRTAQRETWDRFAGGWEKWDPVVLATIGGVAAAMIDSLDVTATQLHLDVASGTGEPGLTIAALAPQGRVVLTDLSTGMLDAARRRAEAKALTNVELHEASADDLPFDDGRFDSVTCRFGLMFFPDLDAAAAEMARVLRDGGRLSAAVWAGPDANPWITMPVAAIGAEVALPPPDPNAPGMFRCAAPEAMSRLFESVGLHDVREWDVPTAMVADSPEQYWQLLNEVAAPVVGALSEVDEAGRDRIAAKVMQEARAYESDGKLRIPGQARCIVGTK